jgi:peptide/nickel transport system substrate-binding protein
LRTKALIAGALLTAAALMVAGCSSSNNSNNSTTTSAPATSSGSASAGGSTTAGGSGSASGSGTASASGSATGSAAATSGGSSGSGDRNITVQLYQLPDSFSPLILQTGGVALIEELHWDSLVGLDDQNKVAPRLADSWDVSADAKTITFHLKQGLKWSDGTPFTAQDVVYTFNLFANPKTGSSYVGQFATVEGAAAVAAGTATTVSGFSAPDDHTFVIKLTTPNSAYVTTLAEPAMYIVPEHVISKLPVDGLAKNQFWRQPTVGLGPYVFSKWVNDNEIEFNANPNYRTKVGADHVYAEFLSSDAALAQMQAGQLDYAQVAVADLGTAKAMKGVTVVTTPGTGVMALHTAIDSGKLADPRVRQAIMYGINRQAIVDQVLKGQGKVINTLVFGPDWAVPSGLNTYPYDPTKAKALLAEAGWKASTEVDINVVPGQKDRDTMVTIVAAQLQAIGMNVKVKQYQAADLTTAINNRQFDLLPSQYGLFNVDPVTMNARLMCSQFSPNGINISHYCNKDLDALLTQGISTTDQAQRASIYAQAQKIVNNDVPIMVLYAPNIIAAHSDRLQNFKLAGVLTQAFWNAAEWTVS